MPRRATDLPPEGTTGHSSMREDTGSERSSPRRPDGGRPPTGPVGVLLAGGGSARMGQSKEELELGGRPLAAWPASALRAVAPVTVQVGGSPIPGLGWPVWPDLRPEAGPAGGIEAALAGAAGSIVVVCAVDVPFVPAALLRHALRRVRAGAPAAAPWFRNRWHPLSAAYSRELLPHLTGRLERGDHDLQGLLTATGAAALGPATLRAFGDPEVLLANVNRPQDLERARELLGD